MHLLQYGCTRIRNHQGIKVHQNIEPLSLPTDCSRSSAFNYSGRPGNSSCYGIQPLYTGPWPSGRYTYKKIRWALYERGLNPKGNRVKSFGAKSPQSYINNVADIIMVSQTDRNNYILLHIFDSVVFHNMAKCVKCGPSFIHVNIRVF